MLSPPPEVAAPRTSNPTTRWAWTGERIGLWAVLAIAAFLRIWRLDQNEFGNLYYSAAVRSMQESWSNFFFGSFDPLGMVTVDKPPVALWIQAASARLFGFSGIAVLLPQALMGVGSVYLVYRLVRRGFGMPAGLLASLALALTPISVAVDRDNLPDTALVLTLLLAAWALCVAIENGRLASLLLSIGLVGVAFNVKMLAAFLVLPAFYLIYFLLGPGTRWIRVAWLGVASLVLVAISLSWALVVEATPKQQRPYIGGSMNNSALDLALGYNGLARIMGMGGFGPPGSGPPGPPPVQMDSNKAVTANGFPPGPPGGRFPGGFGGTPGLLRFAAPLLAGQITWLMPLAILGGATAAFQLRRKRWEARRACGLLLWAGWLATHWIVFSFARGIFHEYYSTAMAPAVAALFGIGTVALWDESRRGGLAALAVPGALLLTAAWQCYVVWHYPSVRSWLLPVVVSAATISAIALFTMGWKAKEGASRLMFGAALLGLAAVLVCPLVWSITPLIADPNPVIPTAGPPLLATDSPGMGRLPGPPGFKPGQSDKLAALLNANRNDERIVMASLESMSASPLIIDTGLPIVAVGGFAGMDQAVTKDQFVEMVRSGQLRFMMLGGPGGGPGGPRPPGIPPRGGPGLPLLPGGGKGNSEIVSWVREHGKLVDSQLWQSPTHAESDNAQAGTARFRPPFRNPELYDCRPELGLREPPGHE
jgi:4-amino-4-deoxy-L-arabinose transferase-like glycosyltransferase